MQQEKETILVVDDADETRYTITRYLERAGFAVREAITGAEGLALAKEQPALIILDVKLPDISGFEVSQILRKDPATMRIPVLQVSAAFTESTHKVEGLEGGADGYLVFPVERDELIATVRALLRLRRAEGESRKLAEQWQATFDAINHAVCLVDSRGRVERYNQGFVTFLGTVEGITGRPFDECLRIAGVTDPVLFKAPFAAYATTQEVVVGANTFRISISPYSPRENTESGAICVFWDVTSYISCERRLERENERLLAELKEKTAALARLP